jgi:hypothetical protein
MQEPTKSKSLYKGKITIDFYGPTEEKPNRHIYKIRETEEKPLGVTTVTGVINKPFLMGWQEKISKEFLLEKLEKGKITKEDILEATSLHRTKKEKAADSGSAVHNFAEEYILFELKQIKERPKMPKDKKVLNGAMAFLEWYQGNKIKPIASEQLIYSKKNDYVGTLDFKARMNGKLVLIDFKTGKPCEKKNSKYEVISRKPYPEQRYQVAGYRNADEEESGEKYDESWIIYFDKENGNFYPFLLDNHSKDYKCFQSALEIKKREKELS